MTNVTFSIRNDVYERMKRYEEIRWSTFVRKAIERRLDDLETLDRHPDKETVLTMLASEDALRADWENEADERWNAA